MNPKTGNNIINAVRVLQATNDNIRNMINACNEYADGEDSAYNPLNPNRAPFFDQREWLSNSIIKPYLHVDAVKHGKDVYVMNVNLEANRWVDGKPVFLEDEEHCEEDEAPVICLAKFSYSTASDIESLKNSKSSSHWKFYEPLYGFPQDSIENQVETIQERSDFGHIVRRIINCECEWCHNVKSVIYTAIPLMDVTADNLSEKVFGTFDKLSEM